MKDKLTIAAIVDPLLLGGKHTRNEIIEAIRKARPDFKCPSAGISNRCHALVGQGKRPLFKEGPAPVGDRADASNKVKAVKSKTDHKLSAGDIAEPMLLEGKHTRAEIMAEIRRLRPDFKDPSAAVSNRFRDLVKAGKNPGLREGVRLSKPGDAAAVATRESWYKRRLERLDQWARESTEQVEAGFAKLREFQAKAAAEPKYRRIWP